MIAALFVLGTSACNPADSSDPADPQAETEETSELATCVRVIPSRDERTGAPAPPIARAGEELSACRELNDHLASIAHIS